MPLTKVDTFYHFKALGESEKDKILFVEQTRFDGRVRVHLPNKSVIFLNVAQLDKTLKDYDASPVSTLAWDRECHVKVTHKQKETTKAVLFNFDDAKVVYEAIVNYYKDLLVKDKDDSLIVTLSVQGWGDLIKELVDKKARERLEYKHM
jgi:hypothetical protein